ncbi:hypothetical protein D4S03_09220 [bacterium]|nr:MAG: hypothetical protein D4S03_09220 [bacterium]
MIFVPPIVLINTIDDFCLLLFRDRNHQAGAPPHFHVVFPVNAEADLVVTIITSQVGSLRQFYKWKKDACDAMVPVNKDIFPFLTRESVVNCNQAELMTKFELAQRVDRLSEYRIKACKIPSYLKVDVCTAIRKSPLIPPNLKKLVKDYLKSLK